MYAETLHWIDYLVILFSLLISLYIGFYFAKKQTNTNTYFAGSRSIPPWAVGMSILATLISSITFLAYPGEGFKSNWILLVQAIMVVVVLSGLVWFIVPLYRKVIGISTYEYFEKRFGSFARIYTSLAFTITHFTKMGTVFFLMGLALSGMTGMDTLTIIWVIGLVVTVLTLFGGIEAVIWLDVIQGFMLIGGGLLALALILFIPEGGPLAIIKTAIENHKIGFAPYNLDFARLTVWVMVLNGIFYGIQKYGTDQTIVQRYLAANSEKGAVKAALMGVLLSLPVWTLFMFIGTALFSFYKITPFTLPENLKVDQVFPYFITTQVPPGLTGLLLAALIAAAISSLDSDLNCLSAVGVEDYYSRLKPNATDRQKLKVGRLIVLFSGLAAMIIATIYVFVGGQGVLGIVFELYAIFSGGIAGIFILGLFSKKANKNGLNIAIVTCVLFTAYAVLTSTKIAGKPIMDLGTFNFPHHKYMLGVYSHLIIIIIGYLASLLFQSSDPHHELTIYWWIKNRKTIGSNS